MGFPSEKKLKEIRKKLEKLEPSRLLEKNASVADKVKYGVCEQFVIYLRENKLSQAALARKLGVDPARVNEIVKYRIELFTADKLFELAERIGIRFSLKKAG